MATDFKMYDRVIWKTETWGELEAIVAASINHQLVYVELKPEAATGYPKVIAGYIPSFGGRYRVANYSELRLDPQYDKTEEKATKWVPQENEWITVTTRPVQWSSAAGGICPLFSEEGKQIDYPFTAQIERVEVGNENHLGIKAAGFGWTYQTDDTENEIRPATKEEIQKAKESMGLVRPTSGMGFKEDLSKPAPNLSDLKVGDTVVLVTKRPPGWNHQGFMDNYLGSTQVIQFVDEYGVGFVDPATKSWSFSRDCIAKILPRATEPEKPKTVIDTTSKTSFKEGDVVVITGPTPGCLNQVGDIGRISYICRSSHIPWATVKVPGTTGRKGGQDTYFPDLRHATEDEIALCFSKESLESLVTTEIWKPVDTSASKSGTIDKPDFNWETPIVHTSKKKSSKFKLIIN